MKDCDTSAGISTNLARNYLLFPAILTAVGRRPQLCQAAPRTRLFCGGVVLALFICSGASNSAAAAEILKGTMQTADPFAAFVSEASQLFGIPASWIRAVLRLESAGDTRSVSPKGAMGLMQIMPETWAGLRIRYGLGNDPFDAHDNILAGAAYLRELHDRYGEPGFLAAYNAGPVRYEQHLATGQPLPVETQNYVATLAPFVVGEHVDGTVVARLTPQPWTDASLFVARSDGSRTTLALSSAMHDRQQPTPAAIADWTALAPQSAGLFAAIDRTTASP